MGMVRIPQMREKDGRGLKACIERAAQETGTSEFLAARIITHFLEEVTEQVAHGRDVSVPGFGMFAPLLWVPRKPGVMPRMYPGFSGSRAFRNLVELHCPLTDAPRKLRCHRRNHHTSKKGMEARYPSSALDKFRYDIGVQERKLGMDE